MTPGVRRGVLAVHRALGLMLAELLFVVCFSGALAALGHDFDAWLGARGAASALTPADVDAALLAQAGDVSYVHFDRDRGGASVHLSSPAGQLQVLHLGVDAAPQHVLSVQVYLRQFHKGLLLPWGIFLVGATSIVLLIATITGWLAAPVTWRRARTLRLRGPLRVVLADVHRQGGLWLAPFALIIAITGVVYFVEAFGAHPPGAAAPSQAATERLSLEELTRRAESVVPGLEVRAIELPPTHAGEVHVHGASSSPLLSDNLTEVHLRADTGEVLRTLREQERGALSLTRATVDPLHFGTFFGLPGRVLWALFGLLLGAVILTGPWLHAARRQAHPASRAERLTHALGHGVVLLLLLGSTAVAILAPSAPPLAALPPAALSAPLRAEPYVAELQFSPVSDAGGVWSLAVEPSARPLPRRVALEIEGAELPLNVDRRVASAFGARAEQVHVSLGEGAERVEAALTLSKVSGAEAYEAPLPRRVVVFAALHLLLSLAVVICAWVKLRPGRAAG